jgi:hypothetical protein
MIKSGDIVKVLHIDGYGVVLWKEGSNEITVCYPYCMCGSGFWSLVIEDFKLPVNENDERFRAESVAVQDMIRDALKNLKSRSD